MFMTELIDEYYMEQPKQKPYLVRLVEDEKEKKQREESKAKIDNLCNIMKEILNKKFDQMTITNRLVSSSCCTVTSTYHKNIPMKLIMKGQPL